MSEFNRLDAIGENRAWEMEISTMEEAQPTQLTLEGFLSSVTGKLSADHPFARHIAEEVRREIGRASCRERV